MADTPKAQQVSLEDFIEIATRAALRAVQSARCRGPVESSASAAGKSRSRCPRPGEARSSSGSLHRPRISLNEVAVNRDIRDFAS